MGMFGDTAINAVLMYSNKLAATPLDAWEQASSKMFGKGTSSQKKSCPKDAFLGLCEAGLVKNIPRGNYTRSKKNKKYALDAVTALKHDSSFVDDPLKLWKHIMRDEKKAHNEQMDVVTSLWKKGLIIQK